MTAACAWLSRSSAIGRGNTSALFWRRWAGQMRSYLRAASASIRPRFVLAICAGLEWAGLTMDASQNQQTVGCEGRISTEESRLHAWVIPTNEELLIARDTVRCILGEPHS